jgi:Leucine-rich repeat (LRR) protein
MPLAHLVGRPSRCSLVPPYDLASLFWSLAVSVFRFLTLSFLGFSLCGCAGDLPPKNPVAVSEPEAAAIKAFLDAGAKVTTNESGSATELDLRKLTLPSDSPELLAELKSLRVLNLADSSFSDALLPALEKASLQLVSLDLRGCEISDKATTVIARFTGLRALRLSGKNGKTSIGDDGLTNLAQCPLLKVLALDDLWIGNAGLEALTNLKALEELYLAGTVVDDDSAKIIAGFPALKKLRLARTQISDLGLETLSTCSTLEDIDLSEDSLITNAGMAHLAKLTNLRKLNLWRVQISDDGVLMLAPLIRLEWLNLDNTKLSDAGLPALKNMNALTFLHLGSTQITAAAAPSLIHLKSLKDLKVTRTALGGSDSAIAEIRKNLADTVIQTEYVEAD